MSDKMSSLVSTKFHYFKIVPPARPYIIIPPLGMIIDELAGGNILKTRNRDVVDPTYYGPRSWIIISYHLIH